MTPAQEALSKVKSLMLMSQVFYATVIMGTALIEATEVFGRPNPTLMTDMIKIYYNAVFLLTELKTSDLIMFGLAHEVMHIVLMHGFRRGHRNAKWIVINARGEKEEIDIWGVSCDYAVNWILKKSKFTIWDKAYIDPRFDGMPAEQIYDILVKESGGMCSGKEPGKAGGFGKDIIEAMAEMDPATQIKAEQHIKRMVADAVTQARLQGQLPGHLARIVEGILNPPLPWDRLFRDFASRIVPCDETWSKRNRRFPHVYLPGRLSYAMGEVVIIGDTSGSMPDAVFPQVGAEVTYMREVVNPERVRIIWADDIDCELMQVFEPGDDIVLTPMGNGGTDMRKPLRYVERFDPICVVLITDCDTPWPSVRPPYPLITVSTNKRKKCPHGETVYFNSDD